MPSKQLKKKSTRKKKRQPGDLGVAPTPATTPVKNVRFATTPPDVIPEKVVRFATTPPEVIPDKVPKTGPVEPTPLTVPAKSIKLSKTKRQKVELTVPELDAERYRANAEANTAALEKIYAEFYDGSGRRLSGEDRLKNLYSLMGKGAAGYLKDGVSDEDFRAFLASPDSRVQGQRVSAYQKAVATYNKKLAAYNAAPPPKPTRPKVPKGPATNQESVQNGDYFHVHNQHYDKSQDLKGRARRIIVNVKTQKAGLNVAKSLTGLFKDDKVSPFLREYKIFLSATADSTKQVKYDKLVVYYALGESQEDGSDEVGDRIVSAIEGAVKPEDIDEGFAPFYSRVGPGIAWAEEPKYFVESLQGSFTTTRSDIIAKAIKATPNVASKEDFIALVSKALETAKVDPVSPHRHLVGAVT